MKRRSLVFVGSVLAFEVALPSGVASAAPTMTITQISNQSICYKSDIDGSYANPTPYNESSPYCRDFAAGNDWNAFRVASQIDDYGGNTYGGQVRITAAVLADDNGSGNAEFQAGVADFTYQVSVSALPLEQWDLVGALELKGLAAFWDESGGASGEYARSGSPVDARLLIDGVEVIGLADSEHSLPGSSSEDICPTAPPFFICGETLVPATYTGSRTFLVRAQAGLEATSTGDEVAVLLGIDDLSGGLDTADDYSTWSPGWPQEQHGLWVSLFANPVPTCGNGIVESNVEEAEACDDGNTADFDGCSAECEIEPCSNGLDDDGDGLVDLVDPQCHGPSDGWENLLTQGLIVAPECQDPGQEDYCASGLGFGLAVSGDRAAVGDAYADAIGAPDSGRIDMHRWTGTRWEIEDSLTRPSPGLLDRFGHAVALDGDRLLAAMSCCGAYVYQRSGSDWIEEAELPTIVGPGSVALSGDWAVMGIPTAGLDPTTGYAFVYRRDAQTEAWVGDELLFPLDGEPGVPQVTTFPGDSYGRVVAIENDLIVIGSPNHSAAAPFAGAVYVYRHDGLAWELETKLMASDAADGDQFGHAVAIDGEFLLIGAPEVGSSQGAVYVFRYDTTSGWIETQKFASESVVSCRMGRSLSASDGTLVAGESIGPSCPPSLFRSDGTTWQRISTLGDWTGAPIWTNHFNFRRVALDEGHLFVAGDFRDPPSYSYLRVAAYDVPYCGDGLVTDIETCDDGGQVSGDGCDAACQIEPCANGLDDDLDGLADLADPGCTSSADDAEREPGLVCDDGLDNDGDTLVDFPADPECSGPSDPSEVPACANGADDDGDGTIDLADAGCASSTDESERSASRPCDDGADNDGDGLADFLLAGGGDPGCQTATSPLENPKCDDDLDNDSDGKIDWDGGAGAGTPDPQCAGSPWKNKESKNCGIGFEVAPVLVLLGALGRRRARKAVAP